MSDPILHCVSKFYSIFLEHPAINDLINKCKTEKVEVGDVILELDRLHASAKIYQNSKLFDAYKEFMKPLQKILALKIKSHPIRQSIDLNNPTINQEPDEETFFESDFTNLIIECYSRMHYGRKMKEVPLFPICNHGDYELNICSKEIWDADFTFVLSGHDCNKFEFEIVDHNSAKDRLLKRFPLVEFLSFQGYVTAGGGPLYAVRQKFYGYDYEGDLDFFIIAENEKEANSIYEALLYEIENIILNHFRDVYNSVYLRNEYCTTCFFIRKPQYKEAPKMKIQIIHQIFENKSQVVSGFDLAPCQILYDGNQFLGTYAGCVSLLTNFIPVDVSNFTENMAYRLFKYNKTKDFHLVFPGLSRKRIFDNVQKDENQDFSITCFDNNNITLISQNISGFESDVREGIYLNYQFSLFLRKTDNNVADYSNDINLNSVAEVSIKNTNHILSDFPNFIHANTIQQFLSNPQCEVSDEPLIRTSLSDLYLENIKYLFGNLAKPVWNAKFENDEELFKELVAERLRHFQEKAKIAQEKLKKINWKVYSIYESAQFFPLKMTARQFYGKQYNGFVCTFDWPAKMQLISAWKRKYEEKDCIFAQILSKDLIKYIFQWMDLLNHSNILIL